MYVKLLRSGNLKKLVFTVALFFTLPIAQAPADVVQEFNALVKNVKSDGRLTLVISTRTYDSAGGLGPVTKSVKMYFSSAAKMSIAGFPKCNFNKLKETRDAKDCKDSIFGRGTASVDVRPLFSSPIDAKLTMFIGNKPKGGNGVMTLIVLAEPITNDPLIKNAKQVMAAPIVRDSSQGPNYSYLMSIDTSIETPPEFSNLSISIASLNTTTKAKTRTKRFCEKKARGKCIKRGEEKIPLYRLKKCPSSQEIFFRADFEYVGAAPISREVKLPCRFKIKE